MQKFTTLTTIMLLPWLAILANESAETQSVPSENKVNSVIARAEKLSFNGKDHDVLALLQPMINQTGMNKNAHFLYTQSAWMIRKHEVIQEYLALSKKYPEDIAIQESYIELLMDSGNNQEAKRRLLKLRQQHPKSLSLICKKITILLLEKKSKAAHELWTKNQHLDDLPPFSKLKNNIQFLLMFKRDNSIIKLLPKLEELAGDNPFHQLSVIQFMYILKGSMFHEKINRFSKEYPNSPYLHLFRSKILLYQKEYVNAEFLLQKALSSQERNHEIHNLLSQVYRALSRHDLALKHGRIAEKLKLHNELQVTIS